MGSLISEMHSYTPLGACVLCWEHCWCVHPSPLCSVTPIFTLSSVSGESLDLLKVFLNILPPLTNSKEQEELMQQLTEFQVPGHRRMGAGANSQH